MRRKVLEALHADAPPVGAYDHADRCSPADGRRLAPISVYRALDFLVEQGFAHRLAVAERLCRLPHGHGADEVVAFLICEDCGGVDEDSSPAIAEGRRSDRSAAKRFIRRASGARDRRPLRPLPGPGPCRVSATPCDNRTAA